jgi:nitric oxide reductase subunit B
METFVWMRVPGDIVFAAGSVLLAVYALYLLRRTSSKAAPLGAIPAAAER